MHFLIDASCVHVQKNDGISELLRLMTSNRDLQVIEGAVDILGSMSAVGKRNSIVGIIFVFANNHKIIYK